MPPRTSGEVRAVLNWGIDVMLRIALAVVGVFVGSGFAFAGPGGLFAEKVKDFVPFLSPTREEVSLKVQAVCRGDLMVSPDTLAFGTVTKGKGAKVSTKVTFASGPNWEIKEGTSTGGYIGVEHKLESRNGS